MLAEAKALLSHQLPDGGMGEIVKRALTLLIEDARRKKFAQFRCGSRHFLEFHHREPWVRAKRHSTDGIELRCRGHNRHAAVQDFGAAHMARFSRRDNWSQDQFDAKQLE